MIRYIAFLRAINVSGQKLIKMEYLREIFAMPGIKNVSSYIQSGNILFDAKEADAGKLTKKIEKQLAKHLGYEVEVFLRTTDELEQAIEQNPFPDAKLGKDLALYIVFLSREPGSDEKKLIAGLSNDIDNLKVVGRELYALIKKDGAKSQFSNMLVERKLKQLSTSRNQTTVNKILELARQDK